MKSTANKLKCFNLDNQIFKNMITSYSDYLKYLKGSAQQTQNIYITFIQSRSKVFDVGLTLYKCYTNVLCLLGAYLGYRILIVSGAELNGYSDEEKEAP